MFRHLYCERDERFLQNLEGFIKQVVGNDFNLSLKKLLFKRNSVEQKIDERAFFCSELVAKTYKECGIFDT